MIYTRMSNRIVWDPSPVVLVVGCALLLETIVRIHGKGTVERMVRKSRRTKDAVTAAAAAAADGKHASPSLFLDD